MRLKVLSGTTFVIFEDSHKLCVVSKEQKRNIYCLRLHITVQKEKMNKWLKCSKMSTVRRIFCILLYSNLSLLHERSNFHSTFCIDVYQIDLELYVLTYFYFEQSLYILFNMYKLIYEITHDIHSISQIELYVVNISSKFVVRLLILASGNAKCMNQYIRIRKYSTWSVRCLNYSLAFVYHFHYVLFVIHIIRYNCVQYVFIRFLSEGTSYMINFLISDRTSIYHP